MKTIEHTNECAMCGDDADYKITVFEAMAPADGQTKVISRAAIRTGYVQLGATTAALCDHCRTQLKHLLDPARPQTNREQWINTHKAAGKKFLEDEAVRIASEEAAAKAEAERIEQAEKVKRDAAEAEARRLEQEEQAKMEAAEAAAKAAQEKRAAEFDALSDADKLRVAIDALLNGNASAAERDRFALLAKAAGSNKEAKT